VTLRGRINAKTQKREGRREANPRLIALASQPRFGHQNLLLAFFASGRDPVALRQRTSALSGARE
jgi:hypothetical protein